MFKNALQLRMNPLFVQTSCSTPQAVLDAHALDFLEAFPEASRAKRHPESYPSICCSRQMVRTKSDTNQHPGAMRRKDKEFKEYNL